MKVRLIIASGDSDYLEHLSRVLSDKYADVFQLTACTSAQRLGEMVGTGRFDVALIEAGMLGQVSLAGVRLSMVLYEPEMGGAVYADVKYIAKYQRISALVSRMLEAYAEEGGSLAGPELGKDKSPVTVVWSPRGGSGKTTVALAYAARQVAKGKQVTYLCLEPFASTAVYFPQGGRSISAAFERLDSDPRTLLMAIRQQDSGSGIHYFCGPDNYDDINVLTPEDLDKLVTACLSTADEVVVDLPSHWDGKVWRLLDMADIVLLVCDHTEGSRVKLEQFLGQHSAARSIEGKTVLVANKGARPGDTGIGRMVQLPMVHAGDATSIYKSLSGNSFEW